MLCVSRRNIKNEKFISAIVSVKTDKIFYVSVTEQISLTKPVTAFPDCRYRQGINNLSAMAEFPPYARLPLVESTSVIRGSKETA